MGVFFSRRGDPPAPEPERGVGSLWPRQQMYAQSYGYAGIDPNNWSTSMQSIAVRSSIDLLASLASELPIDVFIGEGSARRSLPIPGNLEDPSGEGYGLADWRYQAMTSWLTRGNLYAQKTALTSSGSLAAVPLLHPDDVTVSAVEGRPQWWVSGTPMPADQILHRRVNPVPGWLLGLSPLQSHAVHIGVSLTSTYFGYQWFKDGAHPSSVLVNTEEEIDQTKAELVKGRYMASVGNNREPLVMGRGWELRPLQVNAEESQFLATQGATEAQCARIFGPGVAEILGYESGGNLTYANVESRFAHLLVANLDKWLARIDRLLTLFLPKGQYVKINRDALLQTTTAERYRVHEAALRNWWKTINEVRADEDLPPVTWGDEPYFTSKAFSEVFSNSTSTAVSTSKTVEAGG